jgi:alpha-L-arabinofuranosidase
MKEMIVDDKWKPGHARALRGRSTALAAGLALAAAAGMYGTSVFAEVYDDFESATRSATLWTGGVALGTGGQTVTNGQVRLYVTPDVPGGPAFSTLLSVRTWKFREGRTLEFRVDLRSSNDDGALVYFGFALSDGSGAYGPVVDEDTFALMKAPWGPYFFFTNGVSIKVSNVKLVVSMTPVCSDVHLKFKVLDNDNGGAVIFERECWDTAAADPVERGTDDPPGNYLGLTGCFMLGLFRDDGSFDDETTLPPLAEAEVVCDNAEVEVLTNREPALVHVNVDATNAVRPVDTRWFGVNTAIWDGNFENPQTDTLLNEMGTTTLRFPAGSLSDEYHWATGTTGTNTWQWVTSFADFAQAATNIGAEVFITANYGTGTPGEAAGWVRHANETNQLGFRYWEIGNENYGTWEVDSNSLPHDAYTYALRAQDYIAQMKAADPSIKVGVVVTPGESSYANGYTNHPAYNPRTGQTNYGWTPVLLTTLKNLGVTPDFAVHHYYPQWTNPTNPAASPDNDAALLQSAASWSRDAANLRTQIVDYFGPGGTNIELVVTENNSDAGPQGKQSTSLVNGLYYADSLAQLMKTEFNAFIWWNLRNAADTGGCFGSWLYGWRSYGDLGMINGLANRHPTFYAAKLMQHLARKGDTVLNAASDYCQLSPYAVRRANGALSLLVINKSLTTNLNAQIQFNSYAPYAAATLRSYGIPQDEAARTNAPIAAQDIATASYSGAGTNFNYNFPPLSLTLFALPPAPARLAALAAMPPDTFIFELQGQPQVPYIIQRSGDFASWESVSTNLLADSTLTLTNLVPPGASAQFWRAVWQP